jgi:hypothetical protein
MKIKLLFISILILFFSCKNQDETAIIGYHKNVMDSICKKNKPKIDNLCGEIVAIPEIKSDLDKELTLADDDTQTLKSDVTEKAKKMYGKEEIVNPKIVFTEDNTIFITKYSNIISNFGHQLNTNLDSKNYKFNVKLFNDNRPDYSDLPRVWDCYQEKGLIENLKGSLTKSTKKELMEKSYHFLNTISKAKYYAFVDDKFCFIPQLINSETFDSGLLVTSVKIFDAKTKQKIAQKLFYILNNEIVQTFSKDQEGNKMLIKFDLVHNRNEEILNFFKTK